MAWNIRRIQFSLLFASLVILILPTKLAAVWPSDPAVNVPLSEAAHDQVEPQICRDGTGGAIVTWEDYRASSSSYKIDIYAQRVAGNGMVQWTADGAPVCTLDSWVKFPVIASDEQGGAFIAWQDWRNYRDIYAQRLDSRGNPQWAVNGIPICAEASEQTKPWIISDGAGGAFIAWEDLRLPGYRTIYVQRLNASGVSLWPIDGVPVSFDNSHQHWARLVLDGDGGVIVVWNEARFFTPEYLENDIFVQRFNSSGLRLWGDAGVAVTMTDEHQYNHEAVTDGAGGVIIAWEDQRGGYPPDHIYARRVDSSGNPQWQADGVPVCVHNDAVEPPSICSDGAGGAIICWRDNRAVYPPTNSEIYAQRVDADGNFLWTIDGELICSEDYSRGLPRIISDGAGGGIIAWTDNRRYPIYDMYAQRIDGAGMSMWTPNGELVSLGQTANPVLVLATTGCAIVAWQDGSYSPNIHAQDVPLGHLVGVPEQSDLGTNFWLAAGSPNPLFHRTTLRFYIPRKMWVTLSVYDLTGRRVRSLIDERMPAGEHAVPWNTLDDTGLRVASGIYLGRLQVDGSVRTSKLVVHR